VTLPVCATNSGNLAQRLAKAMRATQARRIGRVDNLAQHLILLDPKQVLARGYSLVQDAVVGWCRMRGGWRWG